jgi:hypothetical protein
MAMEISLDVGKIHCLQKSEVLEMHGMPRKAEKFMIYQSAEEEIQT